MRSGICFLLLLITTLAVPESTHAEVYDYGSWSFACAKDHKDPYGDVLVKRHCWAMLCGQSGSIRCVRVFYFSHKHGERIAWNDSHHLCDYPPRKIAVDGRRIDTLPMPQQIEAVVKGDSMTREVWENGTDGSWPYCSTTDVTVSLKGSAEVYHRLKKLAPSVLGADFGN